jgi:LCP family protein required for cell wall assembly
MQQDKEENKTINKSQVNDKKKKHKIKWWHFVVGIVSLIIIGVIATYLSVTLRLNGNTKKVSGWDQIPHTTTGSGQGGTLNDSNFNNIKSENYPIIKVTQKDPNIENILFIGIDGGDPGEDIGHRSDSMIVMSINTKNNTVKMTSILRDTKAYFPDKKAWAKLNAAYAYGGAGQTVNIINYNFKLDIQQYVLADFSGFKNIVNAAGGVTIKVTNKETTQIPGLSRGGTYNLNGTQALAYSRIREIDSDFVRTQRQRTVLLTLYNKFKGDNLVQKGAVVNEFLNYVKTNIPSTELLGKLLNFSSLMNGNIQQLEVPTEGNGMYTTETSPVFYFDLNWDHEINVVSNFIYGK